MSKRVVIIGGGIGGLGSACLLAQQGFEVTLVEKNERLGGRANVFEAAGYRFDMGPSWYLMPDVFEHFFGLLGERVEDHLTLTKLSPSYKIFFKEEKLELDLYSDLALDAELFETIEKGSGARLREYVASSKYQYEIAIREFMYKNYDTIFDFLTKRVMVEGRKLALYQRMHTYVAKYFSSDILQKIMQYQLVFLGNSPYNTPALYNIMSHIDFNMGVYYPQGGVYSIIEALAKMGRARGVTFKTGVGVERIVVENGVARGVVLEGGETIEADIVISNADMAHTERSLLPAEARTYTDRYWDTRTLAPSAFIMYLGLRGRVESLVHHNLLFCKDWKKNFSEIFDARQYPDDPSLYVCCPSKTDPNVAPKGNENLFILVPTPARFTPTQAELDAYKEKILETVEEHMQVTDLRERIEFSRVYSAKDFEQDYFAQGGSALGLAHTLRQTAIFRPNNISKKVSNLYYVGAGTSPGIGMPICLISAELVYKRIAGITDPEPLQSL